MKWSNSRSRIFTVSFAFIIGAAGIAAAVAAFRPGRTNLAAPGPTEPPIYEVTFPLEPTPVDGQPGHYIIPVTTNLPDGTMTAHEYTDSQGEGGGCCTSFDQGTIPLPLVNNRCTDNDGILQGSNVTVQLIVAPDFAFYRHGPAGIQNSGPTQPDTVLAVLGSDFQNLNGPDVQVQRGVRMLIASHEYQLPADTCVSPYSH
jgi:hypothetical protein